MKAIILFSGGVDSTLLIALAKEKQRECIALSLDYGQRNKVELIAAHAISTHYQIPHLTINIDLNTFANSSLVSSELPVPKKRNPTEIENTDIPNTYVPARNTLFLAYAMGQAELHQAEEIYFGANILDAKAYPDCRPEYILACQGLIDKATKQAIQKQPPQLQVPLLYLNKTEIIQKAAQLKAPLELTFSCYDPLDDKHCGECDACILRKKGFLTAGVADFTRYK